MLDLNHDVLTNIVSYLEIPIILNISKVCKQLNGYCKSKSMMEMISSKLAMKNATWDQLLLRYHRDLIMTVITLLAQLYHADYGLTSTFDKSNINYQSKNTSNNNGKSYDLFDLMNDPSFFEESDDEFGPQFDYSYLEKQAQINVHFKTIILKYDGRNIVAPKEWYNIPYSSKYLTPLPCLNIRPWISVDIPFKQITISSEIKGSVLTISDILFGIRALSGDRDIRISEGGNYKIHNSENYDVFCLEPDFYCNDLNLGHNLSSF